VNTAQTAGFRDWRPRVYLLDVQRNHRLHPGTLLGVEVTPGDELIGQAPGLVAGPGLEGEHELALVDQTEACYAKSKMCIHSA
jgi:hypothetical protein